MKTSNPVQDELARLQMDPEFANAPSDLLAQLAAATVELRQHTETLDREGETIIGAAGSKKRHPAAYSRDAARRAVMNLRREIRLLHDRSPAKPKKRRLDLEHLMVLGSGADSEAVFTHCERKGITADQLCADVEAYIASRIAERRAISQPYLRDHVENGRHTDPALWEKTKAALLAFDEQTRNRLAEMTGMAPEFNPSALL